MTDEENSRAGAEHFAPRADPDERRAGVADIDTVFGGALETDGAVEPAHLAPRDADAPEEEPAAEAPVIAHAAPAAPQAEPETAGVHFEPLPDLAPAPEPMMPEAPAPSVTHEVPGFLSEHAPEHGAAPVAEEAPSPATGASPADTADLIEAARAAKAAETEAEPGAPTDADTPKTDPADTAEIDVDAVEAHLKDPGSTQSFEPIADEQLIDTDSTYNAGTTTSLMWGARSDVGCMRSHNEDSYLVQSPLFCVCDGMGGHAAGEVASSIAVETIAKTAPKTADPAALGAAVEAANAAVIEAALNGLGKPGMGCTATAAYIEGTSLAIAHVGDSRAYLLHEGSLVRITRDHSYVEELVDAGEITADEARVHPNRSVITRALGSDPAMYADHFQISVETGDRLILCSDGLSSMIPDGEIERVAQQSSTAQICTDNLVDAALAAGGADNVTVVVVDLVDDGEYEKTLGRRRRNALVALAAVAVVALLGAAITFLSITNSVYLGVKDDVVAIYTGVPGSFMGLTLHWLQDETTVELADLPEDTQARLREGIGQDGMEAAVETVSKYRKQIFEEQTKAAQDAAQLRSSAAGDAAAAGSAATDTDQTPSQEGGADGQPS